MSLTGVSKLSTYITFSRIDFPSLTLKLKSIVFALKRYKFLNQNVKSQSPTYPTIIEVCTLCVKEIHVRRCVPLTFYFSVRIIALYAFYIM